MPKGCVVNSEKPHEKHLIYRTSDENGKFIGTCILCGAKDMARSEGKDDCPNPKQLTFYEAIVLISDKLHVQRMNSD